MTIVRPAIITDLKYIDSLRKKEGKALGFIPKATYQSVITKCPIDGRKRFRYSRLTVCEDDQVLTGFCYSSFSDQYVCHIFQIVVQEDARRWARASLLEQDVRQEANRWQKSGITCRVAYDLESNFFWRAVGYEPIKKVTSTWLNQRESKSRRPLWLYYYDLGLPLFQNQLEIAS